MYFYVLIHFLRKEFDLLIIMLLRRGAVVKGVEHISTTLLVNIGVARLHYQYLTTSVAVVLVVR